MASAGWPSVRTAPIGLALVAASLLVLAIEPVGIVLSWGFALAGLLALARVPGWRRASRFAFVTFVATLLVGLVGTGISIGWRGRSLASFDPLEGLGILVNFAVGNAILSAAVLLALAPTSARARSLARWALAAGGALTLVMVAVLRGERIAGLIGLFGAVCIGLVVGAPVAALVSTKAKAST